MNAIELQSHLTTGDVSHRLGISKVHTVRLAERGTLPFLWTPLGRLFSADVVERVAAERAERVATPAAT